MAAAQCYHRTRFFAALFTGHQRHRSPACLEFLASLYIRGLIPRRLAIENISDADFIYFFRDQLRRGRHRFGERHQSRVSFCEGCLSFFASLVPCSTKFAICIGGHTFTCCSKHRVSGWLEMMSRKILRRSKSAATWSATSFHSQTNFQYCRPGWKRAGKEASNNPHVNGSPEESCAPGLKSRWTEALVLRGIFIFVTNNSPSFIPNAPNQCIKFW